MQRFLPSLLLLVLAVPAPALAYNFISTDGCPPGQGAAWDMSQGPAQWWLHEAGYPPMDRDAVQQVLQDGFDVWSAPCCTEFANEYVGITHLSARDYWESQDIVEFTSSWPMEWGVSTIAVTLPQIGYDCRIHEADMVFNTRNFTFSTDGTATDLQAVATHEFGHWLGLDHSHYPGSSMSTYYSGGMAERTLTSDDEEGVCALYTVACEGCRSDAECDGDRICDKTTGECGPPACSADGDCPGGTVCKERRCVPGCREQAECEEGYLCQEGSCVRDPAVCTICESCTNDADCGDANYLCLPLGQEGGLCTRYCDTHTDCPGDSLCWGVDMGGQTTGMCFAPDADRHDLCHSGWSCSNTCTGLWQGCVEDAQCDGGICATTPLGGRCTCACSEDADCGDRSRCVPGPDGASQCAPQERAEDACLFVTCEDGFFCSDGDCVADCEGVVCAAGEKCDDGACVAACAPCAAGMRCDAQSGQCVPERPVDPTDPCQGHTCAEGQVCVVTDGAAICEPGTGEDPGPDRCAAVVCNDGYRCEDGACVDACHDVDCPSGTVCDDGTCVAGPDWTKPRDDDGGCAAGGSGPAMFALLAVFAFVYRRH